MPTKIDALRIGKENDGRKKISDATKTEIKKRYESGESMRSIARVTGVSRRQIGFIVNPEQYEAFKARCSREKVWKKFYDKDKHREYMRKHRARLKTIGKNVAK